MTAGNKHYTRPARLTPIKSLRLGTSDSSGIDGMRIGNFFWLNNLHLQPASNARVPLLQIRLVGLHLSHVHDARSRHRVMPALSLVVYQYPQKAQTQRHDARHIAGK